LISASVTAVEFDTHKDMALPASELSFVNINEAIQMADAYDNMNEGMHGTFGRFPANFDAGMHTHTGVYHGIVIQGVMVNPFKNEANPPKMIAGSYWYVPAGSVHSTACISDQHCEFYFYADSKFDFMPLK
jgi:hypothetical protein